MGDLDEAAGIAQVIATILEVNQQVEEDILSLSNSIFQINKIGL